MVQSTEVLAAKPDNPSSVPGVHMVEGENQLPLIFLWPTHASHALSVHIHTHPHMCAHTHIHTHACTSRKREERKGGWREMRGKREYMFLKAKKTWSVPNGEQSP